MFLAVRATLPSLSLSACVFIVAFFVLCRCEGVAYQIASNSHDFILTLWSLMNKCTGMCFLFSWISALSVFIFLSQAFLWTDKRSATILNECIVEFLYSLYRYSWNSDTPASLLAAIWDCMTKEILPTCLPLCYVLQWLKCIDL